MPIKPDQPAAGAVLVVVVANRAEVEVPVVRRLP